MARRLQDDRRRHPPRLLVALVLVALSGCSGPGPRHRIGCLPCPGLLTGFTVADPDDLGEHSYEAPALFWNESEQQGIVYTHNAGFLDVVHVRSAIDCTRWLAERLEPALAAGHRELEIDGPEYSRYHVSIERPAAWDELPEPARRRLTRALAVRAAQIMTVHLSTWHEILTWFGYRTTPLFPETQSAFTYEDIPSHIVGVWVAERALLRSTEPSFDAAVTAELERTLDELDAVEPDETRRAVDLVEGRWWAGGRCLRRNLDAGLDGAVAPWLVPELSAAVSPVGLPVPALDDVDGHDCRGALAFEIACRAYEVPKIRSLLPDAPARFRPREHFPPIIAAIRAELHERYGPEADRP